MYRKFLRVACCTIAALMTVPIFAAKHYVGGDVSLLPVYEEAGAQYKDHDGKPVADVLAFCKVQGMNAMRVRVFVNPADYTGSDKDPNACQTIESVIPLCKRIKAAGLALVLDFMYSDTWADPSKQWTPKQWENLSDGELCQTIHTYTLESLEKLKAAGVTPDFIQPGNEISFGLMWGPYNAEEKELKKALMGSSANWSRLGQLLNNAISACRQVCPDAKIIIHTERVAQPDVQRNFYKQMDALKVDYDIVGISYYPYFHGSLTVLNAAISELETDFPARPIMLVETGYSYKWEVPGTTEKVDYPYSEAGQNEFATNLVATLEKHANVDGLFWWWMEYNAYGTSLTGWYNAPLFDSTTGQATAALKTICSFANGEGYLESPAADPAKTSNVRWFNLQGVPVKNPEAAKGVLVGSDGSKLLK